MNRRAMCALIAWMVFLVPSSVWAGSPVNAVASILPQQYFLQRIADGRAVVTVMVEPGASPATYEPTPRQMAALAAADVYFAIGVPFERTWLKRFIQANPDMRVVHTDEGIAKRIMAVQAHKGRDGGEEHHENEEHGHHHDHGGKDPHIWLSPPLVMQQAEAIAAGLEAVDPEGAPVYRENLKNFVQEVQRLDEHLQGILSPHAGSRFMVYHPSWGYFADTYGLVQAPIEIEGKEPSPRELQELIAYGKEHDVRAIFVQQQFSEAPAQVIAKEIGAEVVKLDPLAQDWPDTMRKAAEAIARGVH